MFLPAPKYTRLLSLLAVVFLVLPQVAAAEGVGALIEGSVQYLLWIFVVNVFGMLVSFGALLLDSGIDTFVIGFGGTFNNSGIGVAVNNTWVIIRDFVNLFFIFGLVYIGLRMILDSDSANTRRWLARLIMAAILVNFSLFATKFVIDFSNKLSLEIADAGLGAEEVSPGVYKSNVGGELMDRMGITSALGGTPPNSGWGYIIGTAILFMVSAFVFAAGGILLIIRFAILNLFLVLSPIMFASWILPGISDTMNRYWKDFIKRCFFAPIYLVFIYFSFQIIGGLQQTIGTQGSGDTTTNFANPNWAATLGADSTKTPQDATLGTLPFFVMICIFMIASLVAANKLGAEGAGRAMKIGKSWSNKAQRFTARNTAGIAAQQIVGRGAEALNRRYDRLDAQMSQTKGGRFARKAISVASLGALTDKNVKAGLKAAEGASVAGSETYSQYTQRQQTIQKRQNTTNDQLTRERDFKINNGIVTDSEGIMSAAEKEDARNKLAATIRKMSDDEIKGLSIEDLLSQNIATHLSDAQIKTLADSGQFRNDQIKGIRDSRNNGTFSDTEAVFENTSASADDLAKAFESLGKTIKGFSEERLSGLGVDKLSNKRIAANLSDAQIESLQKSGKLGSVEIDRIKAARKSGITELIDPSSNTTGDPLFKAAVASDPTFVEEQRRKLMQRSPQDAGKLPVDIFTNKNMASHLTPAIIEQRMRNGDISNAQLQQIKLNVEGHITALKQARKDTKMWDTWKDRSTYGAQFFSA